ncbi:MAG: rhamnulokinase [Verrucomicrobiae bacterium]|nr:rhamnulokinase [Verrucomicrobiae bacterium]
MKAKVYLGIDLGAESGRVIAGVWDGKKIKLEELHRFANGPVYIADSMRWDVLKLWSEIQTGLSAAAKRFGSAVVSVGTDTWGVDFVLLSKHDEILGLPYHYRDSRTRGALERAFKKVPRAEIFAQTGIQFMELNSLYQLIALYEHAPELLETADCLLFMPDFFHWCLCGSRAAEFTIASTSQFLHPTRRNWSYALLKKFRLPTHFLPKLVPPGTELGALRESVASQTGLKGAKVIAPPSHDTAAAVAGVPTTNTGKTNWAYLSSGTWSLMGVEAPKANLSKRALELNFTNEGGVNHTYRLLKNIMGLWLVQQCRRAFDVRGAKYDYAQLVRLAAKAPALRSLVNPDDPSFFNPPDMPAAIQAFCRKTGQPVPQTEGELVRCALESLALKYRMVLLYLQELTGNRIDVIHIVGGGSQNDLLNQFAATACERPVLAGPVEATALGNVLVQAMASGEIGSLAELRQVVRKSFDVREFEPEQKLIPTWRAAYERFVKICAPAG